MQVMDESPNAAALPITRMESQGWTGFRIADRVVIFPSGHEDVANVRFNAPAGGVYACITGASVGLWKIRHSGGEIDATTDPEGRMLVFHADAGEVEASFFGPVTAK